MHRPWTRLEEARLVELRTRPPRLTVAGIARVLGRTPNAIKGRLEQLRVRVHNRVCRGGLADLVRRAWRPGRSDYDIARLLGRSRPLITRTRNRLGLPSGCDPAQASRRRLASQRRPACWGCGVKAPCRSQVERFGWSAQFHDDAKEREVYCPRCVAEYGRPTEDS